MAFARIAGSAGLALNPPDAADAGIFLSMNSIRCAGKRFAGSRRGDFRVTDSENGSV